MSEPDAHLQLQYEPSQAMRRLLALLGLSTQEGALREEGRDKLAQVLAMAPLVEKAVRGIGRRRDVVIVECASGKGHLSLILNQMLSEGMDRRIQWIGIDHSERLINRSRSIAEEMGFDNVEFHVSKIADFQTDRDVSILLALHACDTATDEAVVKAIELKARYAFFVPCCQREIPVQLKSVRARILEPLTENYTHRRLLGSILTDSLRRLVLESFGYEVDVFEYVSVRRTEKNVMIRAARGAVPSYRSWSLFKETLRSLGLEMTLERLLDEKGMQPVFVTR